MMSIRLGARHRMRAQQTGALLLPQGAESVLFLESGEPQAVPSHPRPVRINAGASYSPRTCAECKARAPLPGAQLLPGCGSSCGSGVLWTEGTTSTWSFQLAISAQLDRASDEAEKSFIIVGRIFLTLSDFNFTETS